MNYWKIFVFSATLYVSTIVMRLWPTVCQIYRRVFVAGGHSPQYKLMIRAVVIAFIIKIVAMLVIKEKR